MSWVEDRLAVLASPARARSLFTVRAVLPRSRSLSSTCSYCCSLLVLQFCLGMIRPPADPWILVPGQAVADVSTRSLDLVGAGGFSRAMRTAEEPAADLRAVADHLGARSA